MYVSDGGPSGRELSPEEIREKLNLHWPRVSEAYNWMVDLSKAVALALRKQKLTPEKVAVQWQGGKELDSYWTDDRTAHMTKISTTITLPLDCSVEITTAVFLDMEVREIKVTVTQSFPTQRTLIEEKSFYSYDDWAISYLTDKVLRFVFSSIESFVENRLSQATHGAAALTQTLKLLRASREQDAASVNPQ